MDGQENETTKIVQRTALVVEVLVFPYLSQLML